MSSPPISNSASGSRRARYSRSPSTGGAPPSKRSKPSNSNDTGNNSDQHRVYTSICVKNISSKISDPQIRELCDKKFSKYGQNSVKIYYKNQERVAFVNFTNADDARKARHAKTGLVWENAQVVLEPVYYRRTVPAEQPITASPRSRSRSPASPPPRRRPAVRRPPTPSPPRSRHRRSPTPPRPRRHYSPYIPIPPDLAEYAGRPQHDSSPSPVRTTIRRRSRSASTSPVGHKNRSKNDDFSAGRGGGAESNVQHEPTRTLFVGNLERDIKESKIREVFGRYGKIEEVDLKVPQSSSKRAYAFIQYENMDMAFEARRAMDGRFIGKADCKIGYGKIVPTNCLWVGNIPIDMKRRDLEQAFSRYGQVKSLDYTNGEPIAIVSYNEIEDAIKARGKMTGVTQFIDGKKVRADSGQSDSSRQDGLRIDYLDRPTARRFVIVRPQDNTTPKDRASRSTSHSSISNDDVHEPKSSNQISRSPSPIDERSPSPAPSVVGQTFAGPLGTYLSPQDAEHVTNINDLFKLCDKLVKSNTKYTSIFPVEFVLKSHAYEARLHFLAGNPQLAEKILLKSNGKVPELQVTQRLRLDPHKLDELEQKLRSSVDNASTRTNSNRANQTKFAIFISSTKSMISNGNHSSSPNDKDSESSLSHLISYLNSKEAAGIITLPYNDKETVTLNIFAPCKFSRKFLRIICPSISFSNGPRTPPSHPTADEHLMVIMSHNDGN